MVPPKRTSRTRLLHSGHSCGAALQVMQLGRRQLLWGCEWLSSRRRACAEIKRDLAEEREELQTALHMALSAASKCASRLHGDTARVLCVQERPARLGTNLRDGRRAKYRKFRRAGQAAHTMPARPDRHEWHTFWHGQTSSARSTRALSPFIAPAGR